MAWMQSPPSSFLLPSPFLNDHALMLAGTGLINLHHICPESMSPAATVSISKTLFSRGIHAQIFHLNKNLGAFALKTT